MIKHFKQLRALRDRASFEIEAKQEARKQMQEKLCAKAHLVFTVFEEKVREFFQFEDEFIFKDLQCFKSIDFNTNERFVNILRYFDTFDSPVTIEIRPGAPLSAKEWKEIKAEEIDSSFFEIRIVSTSDEVLAYVDEDFKKNECQMIVALVNHLEAVLKQQGQLDISNCQNSDKAYKLPSQVSQAAPFLRRHMSGDRDYGAKDTIAVNEAKPEFLPQEKSGLSRHDCIVSLTDKDFVRIGVDPVKVSEEMFDKTLDAMRFFYEDAFFEVLKSSFDYAQDLLSQKRKHSR